MTDTQTAESSNGHHEGLWGIRSGHVWREADGTTHSVTNVSWRGEKGAPGSRLIGTGAWLLAALGAGLLYVSFSGQLKYIFFARHQHVPALIESGMLDVGMIIFSLLALGLARAGKSARTERALIMACSFGSAAMNYGASDTASPRSVAAFVAAPVFLAIVVDRVIAVVRRHMLGDSEASAWTSLGRGCVAAAKLSGLVLLYSLRFALATRETSKGVRRMVLNATPLPGAPLAIETEEPAGIEPPTKKAALIKLYRAHADYGNRDKASQVAAELAPQAELQAGTARSYIYAELNGKAS